jgi:amino acid transporter
LSAIARLVAYGATCAALLALRHNRDVPEALFKVPAGAAVSIAGVGLSGWLLFNIQGREALNAAVLGAVGLLIFQTRSRWQRNSPLGGQRAR